MSFQDGRPSESSSRQSMVLGYGGTHIDLIDTGNRLAWPDDVAGFIRN